MVIGQAGERDPYKRPKVGNVVVENATHAIFTYEDPRSEDPMKICEDIISELKATHSNYEIVIDRREAIQKAINMAGAKDISKVDEQLYKKHRLTQEEIDFIESTIKPIE